MNPDRLKAYLSARKRLVDEALDRYLPGEDQYPPDIFRAVRYSLFAGGKRIRPILCLAAAEAVGGAIEPVLPFACALELIHTYSLIHDDLPAMDDDDYRRGMLTSHKVFGEGMSILAGDALLTEAFRLMSERSWLKDIPPEKALDVIHETAVAAGFGGMVGGQVVDLKAEGQDADPETLHYIHTHKTGAMIIASLRAGALLSGAGASDVDALSLYGRHIGLAFQIADDILNVEGDKWLMGKDTGSDVERKKMTYPSLMGLDASRDKAAALADSALAAIQNFDERAWPLRMIVAYIVERKS